MAAPKEVDNGSTKGMIIMTQSSHTVSCSLLTTHNQHYLSHTEFTAFIQGWKKCKISLEYGQKLRQKCELF